MIKLFATVSALALIIGNPALAQFSASSPIAFGWNFNKNPANGQVGVQGWDNWIKDPFPIRSYKPDTGLTAVNNGDISGQRTTCTSNSTGVVGGLDPGWSNSVCQRVYYDFFHGTNTGAQKTTDIALGIWGVTFGAAQSFGLGVYLNSLSAHDHQNIVVSNNYYGGIASSGDEGPVGYGMSMTNPDYYETAHVYGSTIKGGGNAHTTAALTATSAIQSIPVDNAAGFTVGEWVVINTTSPAYATGYKQAMQITAVGPGNAISGLVEIDQVANVPITPATMVPINIQTEWASYGEHRWLINTDQATYNAGNITWGWSGGVGIGSPTGSGSSRVTGTGTAFSNSMIGGDALMPGCFSQDSDTNSYGAPAWFPIQSVDSPTQLTTVISRQTDPVPLNAAAYHVRPCGEILRILGFDVPGTVTGYVILETNNFPWPNVSTIHTGYGPSIGANGATYNMFDYLRESRSVPLQLSEEGSMAPLGTMLGISNFGTITRTVAGGLQNSFIFGRAVPAQSGGPSIADGIYMSGMRDGAQFSYASGYVGLDHLGVIFNSTPDTTSADFFNYRTCCSMEFDPIWNFTDRVHTALGGTVTDNSTRTDNKLISISYDNGATGGPQERFAVTTDGTITKGQLAPGLSGIYPIFQTNIPFFVAPSGTMGNNGAVTLNTPIPTGGSGVYLNFPVGAIYAGSAAGWWCAVIDTTCVVGGCTQGHVYANTPTFAAPGSGLPSILTFPYTSGQPYNCYGVGTPITAAGPGVYTGVTAAVNGPTYTIPGNGKNNYTYEINYVTTYPANTDTKTTVVTYGGHPLGTIGTSSAADYGQVGSFSIFSGNPPFQAFAVSNNITDMTAPLTRAAVNMTNPQPFTVTMQMSSPTDYIGIEHFVLNQIQGPEVAH
jgi:hypothetical protein